jgi:hypothetical protein
MLIHSRAKNPSDLSGLETVLQFVDCRDFELFVDAKNTPGIELWKLQDASQLGRHLRLEGVKLPRRSGFDYLPNHTAYRLANARILGKILIFADKIRHRLAQCAYAPGRTAIGLYFKRVLLPRSEEIRESEQLVRDLRIAQRTPHAR